MRTVLLVLLLFVVTNASAQKLVLKNGMHRVKLKPGKQIGVTEKGESFHYSNWKSVCSGCYHPDCMDSTFTDKRYQDSTFFYYRDCRDTLCIAQIWTLDSVKDNCIVLRRLSDDTTKYRLDTINIAEYDRYERNLRKQHKEPVYVEVDSITGEANVVNLSYIVLVATDYDRKTVSLDSLSSLTFSRADHCATFGLGVPLMAAALAIGSPIVAADKSEWNGKFGWAALLVGEAMAGYITWSMVRNIKSLKVRTYDFTEWKVRSR